jgi:hypothetical protein
MSLIRGRNAEKTGECPAFPPKKLLESAIDELVSEIPRELWYITA